MTSLGYRPRNDHIAERARPISVAVVATEKEPVAPARSMSERFTCAVTVPRGILPVLFYSAVAAAIPVLLEYTDYDYSDRTVRGVTVGAAALAATIMLVANCCCCWYNMLLFFHTALEVKVVDTAITFARAPATSDADMAWALVGAAVIIAHLIPLFLVDRVMLLTTLAYAGVIVNATVLVHLDPSRLLLVGGSSLALLANTMILVGVCEVGTSMLGLLRNAMRTRSLITCKTFGL